MLAVALVGVAVGLISLITSCSSVGPQTATQLGTLLVLGLLTAVRTWISVVHAPAYGTDELAFDQYAAQLLLNGHNPYTNSMAPALQMFQVPEIYHTFTLSGGTVSSLSYPAGSFLFYIPTLLMGFHMQAATFTDVAMWIIDMFLFWCLLPFQIRWAAALLLGSGVMFGNAVGGVTDVLYLPFACVALWKWDQFTSPTASRLQRWAGPISLGLACSIKQTPWFLLPFLLAGTFLEAYKTDRKPTLAICRYFALAAAAFSLINLPFILASPAAFIHGILTPLIAPTIPGGQGLIGLAMFTARGGYLVYYTLAAAFIAMASFACFVRFYSRLKLALVTLAVGIFFFPPRSFDEYFIEVAPMILVGLTTVKVPTNPNPIGTCMLRWWSLGAASSMAIAFIAVGLAVTSSPPLKISVLSENTTGQLATIDKIRIEVFNQGKRTLLPHYSINQVGQPSSFWNVIAGPVRVLPGQHASVLLSAPDTSSMPSELSSFVVNAYLSNPAAVVTSARVTVQSYNTVLFPLGVTSPVRVGNPVDVTVQLTNQLGANVHRAGVRVELGQVIYARNSLELGEVSINGSAEGKTPVSAVTNQDGVARFTLRSIQAQADPVFFEAWLLPRSGIPSSYSNLLSILFVH